jgi:hypothetical protein
MNETDEIKGSCEHCGFAFKGTLEVPFSPIKCPRCGEQTNNFDHATEVDARDKEEHYALAYKDVEKFETIE